MAQGWNRQYQTRALDQAAIDAGLRQYMLSVYNYMAGGLALTGIVALLVASSPAATAAIFGTPLKWLVMLAPLGFVMVFSVKIQTMSASTAQTLFWAFAGVMGLSMASIFLVFTGESVARVFFITAGAFGATSLWGYTTKADLSKMGGFLMMGVFGIIIAGVVNIFLGSSQLQFLISIVGVLVFAGLTAYDTQSIKEMYNENYDQQTMSKLAISGALTLYLDFINMFQFLLQLMGQRRD